ncbi:hypothetical protein [Glaciimonas sp. PCH181]|uniref:hypothetical protein n=1 Tax=Glaciimonas sp. PCH181 TaxID=2133943 RepID=UPI000D33ACDF|nr:hypothetical protein [Glaciimonas sp. PCH181]PUA17734.1 hypothetical protein C7W93_17865 [Glaciimonas sp. PCH181]
MQSVKHFHLQDDSAAAIAHGLRTGFLIAVIYCAITPSIGQLIQAATGHPHQFHPVQQSDDFR